MSGPQLQRRDAHAFLRCADALCQLSRAKGLDSSKAVLAQFGVDKLSDAKPDQYDAIRVAAESALKPEPKEPTPDPVKHYTGHPSGVEMRGSRGMTTLKDRRALIEAMARGICAVDLMDREDVDENWPMHKEAATAALSALEAAGVALVPKEPTREMMDALRVLPHSYVHSQRDGCQAVINASPFRKEG